ncbi:MAG: hypothetical protein IPK93_06955 [Solirubrobacterales bacterium]|nr:hypothetical protein [Solirubrobacterales bacterium]
MATSAILAGCGGGEEPGSQFANEPAGDYPVEVISADFAPRQTIAKTYDLKIAVRNSGDKTIPAMAVTINLPGEGSTLAFAYHDDQVGVAQPQRPVWVLEEGYPKLAGTIGRGGAGTSNRRTFNFGAVEAGDTARMIWRVVAVKPGARRLTYRVNAGLGGNAEALDASGEPATGVLPTFISARPVLTKIDENGKVVPLTQQERLHLESQELKAEN